MTRRNGVGWAALVVTASWACGSPGVEIDDVSMADETAGENWLAFGRTYSEQRFSPLDQISTATVGRLSPAWYLDLPNDVGLVSTPLIADGILYFIGTMNVVRAVDAATGELIWVYDPEVGRHAADRLGIGWTHSRGIGLWKDKVYVATVDGRLNAIDRVTGNEIWSVQTFDPELAFYITGAPKIFKGKVLVGNGGTERGPARGFVTAYDAETGEQAWRFYLVPGNPVDGFENETMEMAAETWTGEWWRYGGGGNAWHGFTYDAELDQLYVGTGNGAPWNWKIRSPGGGDNLFLSSIVALDPETGEYIWHYQNTPGEAWDFNSNMDIVLADLTIDGREIKAILHAPKNGFFYVIDRTNGRLVSAEPYTEVTWASHVDLETGRPVETPGARYQDGTATVAPGPFGGHNWHAMSYNPGTGLAYFPALHLAFMYSHVDMDLGAWRSPDWRRDPGIDVTLVGSSREDGILGSLVAWDPVRQEVAWEVPTPELWNSGTMTTAGNLVFQGRADGNLVAFDASTGAELWHWDLGLGISAPPVTYSIGETQYVAVLVGWGGGMAGLGASLAASRGWAWGVHTRRLVAFALDGDVTVPPQPPRTVARPLASDEFEVNAAAAERGGRDFTDLCQWCHGPGAIGGGMAPDLRASGVVLSRAAFFDVVRAGSRAARGMPAYPRLSDDEIEALRHYIRRQAELPDADVAAMGN